MIELFGYGLLPDWPALLAYAVADLALNLMPGADMAFVIASSTRAAGRPAMSAATPGSAGPRAGSAPA